MRGDAKPLARRFNSRSQYTMKIFKRKTHTTSPGLSGGIVRHPSMPEAGASQLLLSNCQVLRCITINLLETLSHRFIAEIVIAVPANRPRAMMGRALE